MTAKFLTAIALMASILSDWAQPAKTATEIHGAVQGAAGLSAEIKAGRVLFLRNCAHCHGATAYGDDGPDLHHLDSTDERIASRILKGKPGQMTAFAGKLQSSEVAALVAYVQSLK